MKTIRSSEITPQKYWVSRRDFISAGTVTLAMLALGGCARQLLPSTSLEDKAAYCDMAKASRDADDQGNLLTSCDVVTGYNNYFEFSSDKEGIGELAHDFKTEPWTVKISGLVNNPGTYDIADLVKKYPPQERIYRLRCVEAWAMVIPWLGFPLSDLIRDADPQPSARYVRFESLNNPAQKLETTYDFVYSSFDWPYVDGLRLDEAMHPLTLLATGLYGLPMPPQNGAPLRLVVPWKYGFKSIKSIVKIDLVSEMPVSLWMSQNLSEYGFYANVNPEVPHPRWAQSSERIVGGIGRRETQLFNGYGAEVAYLYAGMDLHQNY